MKKLSFVFLLCLSHSVFANIIECHANIYKFTTSQLNVRNTFTPGKAVQLKLKDHEYDDSNDISFMFYPENPLKKSTHHIADTDLHFTLKRSQKSQGTYLLNISMEHDLGWGAWLTGWYKQSDSSHESKTISINLKDKKVSPHQEITLNAHYRKKRPKSTGHENHEFYINISCRE